MTSCRTASERACGAKRRSDAIERRFLVQIFCGSGRLRRPERKKGGSETLVVDGPHMDRAIDLEYEPEWEGTRGTIRITDAKLG